MGGNKSQISTKTKGFVAYDSGLDGVVHHHLLIGMGHHYALAKVCKSGCFRSNTYDKYADIPPKRMQHNNISYLQEPAK